MKKLLLITLVLFVTGCEYKYKKPEVRYGASEVFIVNVKGHDYVIFDGSYKGGIVHAESCSCKSNKEKVK